jgi:hypothetical protein
MTKGLVSFNKEVSVVYHPQKDIAINQQKIMVSSNICRAFCLLSSYPHPNPPLLPNIMPLEPKQKQTEKLQ